MELFEPLSPFLYSYVRSEFLKCTLNPAGNYMFKVSNRNTRKMYEIYSKLTIKTPE